MSHVHVVWDWNGTLLADLPYVLTAVSRAIGRYGLAPLEGDDYRDHFTRPVRAFYDSLFGRPVSDMEWLDLNKTFHEFYYEAVDDIPLAPGGRASLERASDLGWGQSLLSMSTHDRLLSTVRAHGIGDFFNRIDGLDSPTGELKEVYLKSHLDAMSVDPDSVWLIGDTPDDHDAARAVGARVVLYDGGSHHREDLDVLGVPVAASLPEAVEMVLVGAQ
jgi:phosphoglycolate phosphatase-like HAD superfamily hydrolase